MNEKIGKHKASKTCIERERSLQLIEEFFEREYDHLPDFSNMHHINIGTTEHEMPKGVFNTISVDVDLVDFAIRTYLNNVMVIEKRYDDLSVMNDKELADPCLDILFDVAIEDTYNGLEKNRELAVSIIDVFENFLYNKGIEIPNEDKTGDSDEAIIYGLDYSYLEEAIKHILDMEG